MSPGRRRRERARRIPSLRSVDLQDRVHRRQDAQDHHEAQSRGEDPVSLGDLGGGEAHEVEDQDDERDPHRAQVALPAGVALSTKEVQQRLSILAALLGSKPVATSQSLEIMVETYMAMTEDVPLRWLRLGVKWHLAAPERFAPSIGELRARAATEILRSVRKAEGADPDRGNNGQLVHVKAENIDHWVRIARKAESLPDIPPPMSEVAELPEGWKARVNGLIESMSRRRAE